MAHEAQFGDPLRACQGQAKRLPPLRCVGRVVGAHASELQPRHVRQVRHAPRRFELLNEARKLLAIPCQDARTGRCLRTKTAAMARKNPRRPGPARPERSRPARRPARRDIVAMDRQALSGRTVPRRSPRAGRPGRAARPRMRLAAASGIRRNLERSVGAARAAATSCFPHAGFGQHVASDGTCCPVRAMSASVRAARRRRRRVPRPRQRLARRGCRSAAARRRRPGPAKPAEVDLAHRFQRQLVDETRVATMVRARHIHY